MLRSGGPVAPQLRPVAATAARPLPVASESPQDGRPAARALGQALLLAVAGLAVCLGCAALAFAWPSLRSRPGAAGGAAVPRIQALHSVPRPSAPTTAGTTTNAKPGADPHAGLTALRQRLFTPGPMTGLPAAAFADAAGVLREAKVAQAVPAAAPSSAGNRAALVQAQSDVQAAEQALQQALSAAPLVQLGPTASATPGSSALAGAQAELASAETRLQTLEAGSTPADVTAAQQAVNAALAAVPAAPSESALADARSRVVQAQQTLSDVSTPAFVADAAAAPQGYVAPINHATLPGPTAARAPQPAVAYVARVPDPTKIANAQADLDSAKAAAAALRQQASYAANPETQPAVVAAEQRLAAVRAVVTTPEQIAAAQAAVDDRQQQVDQLSRAAGSSPGPYVTGPDQTAVAAAEQRLSLARRRFSDLSGGDAGGGRTPALTPQQRLARSSPVARGDLTATEVANGAQYVASVVMALESPGR